ncbi:MAG: hypothetical protein ACRD2F_00685 [Terriglobales bacterium]
MKRAFYCGGGARGRVAWLLPLVLAALVAVMLTVPAWAGSGGRRDPFHSLIPKASSGKPGAPTNRPPGRAGLEIGQLTVQGLALGGPTGSVALVAGRSGGTYFLRPGEHIFDGVVLRLTPNGIWFRRTKVVSNGQVAGQQTFRAIDPAPGEGK